MRLKPLLLALTASQLAFASNWISLGDGPNAKGNEILVDTASITESALGRKAWVKHKYGAPQKMKATIDKEAAGKPFTEMMNLMTFDCDQRTLVIEHTIFLDSEGNTVADVEIPYRKQNDVPPDSVLELIFHFVCDWPRK